MSRIALGTAQFGLTYGIANQDGKVERAEAAAMVRFAAAHGVDTIDTAIAYGDSESCLGQVGMDGMRVVTKLPALPPDCPDVHGWVRGQVLASCARLGCATLDALLLHRPLQLLEPEGADLYAALCALKHDGLTRKIGVSVYAPAELDALTARFRFDLVQAPFSIVDRRLRDSGWLRRLHGEGVEVHARSVFLQGLLLLPAGALPDRFAPWRGLFARWHAWLAENGISAVAACLAFVLAAEEVARVVVGVDNMGQLAQILAPLPTAPAGAWPALSSDAEQLINPARWQA